MDAAVGVDGFQEGLRRTVARLQSEADQAQTGGQEQFESVKEEGSFIHQALA